MRKVIIALGAALLCAARMPAFAVDLTVYGQPPLGAFGIESAEHVEACSKLGMNLLFTYSAAHDKQFLDMSDPMGKALLAHKMQVMYNLCSRFTNVRLAGEVAPGDATIAVIAESPADIDAFPPSGMLAIEGERIAYAAHTRDAFTGCVRGAGRTKAGHHPAGLLLCNSEALKQDILKVKDSPNLWGYWLVDDCRPFEGDCLKEMVRVMRANDRRPDGKPNHHVILMGIGGSLAMENFSPGICDALGVYLYPYHNGKLNKSTRRELTYIMHLAKSLQPDIGLIGIPQLFQEQEGAHNIMPTPEQAREDALAYLEQGAAGFVPFIYHWPGRNGVQQGFDAFPAVCQELGKVYAEMRDGTLKPGHPTFRQVEWYRALEGRDARLSRGVVALDFSNPASLEALQKEHPAGRITLEPHEYDGQRYVVKMSAPRFDRSDPKSDERPLVKMPANLLAATDWSKYRYLEQPLYNPMDHTVAMEADLAGSDGYAWERAYIPVPPQTPVLLRLPISEAGIVTDVSKIRHWQLWFEAPKEDIALYLGNPVLVPQK